VNRRLLTRAVLAVAAVAALAAGLAVPGTRPDVITLVVLASVLGLYFAPSIVAGRRRVPSVGSVLIINLFLGWTLVGWIVALAMAFRDPRRQP
jgi:T4 superinfection immunity protein